MIRRRMADDRAFLMPTEERQRRMRGLRRTVEEQDVYWWVDAFLSAAAAKDPAGLPDVEDYIPRVPLRE